jgi:tetratricopeptide (TPR) repeat protein
VEDVKEHQHRDAREHLNRRCQQRHRRNHAILAQVYVRLERWSELEDLLVSALKEAPDDLVPYYTAAQVMVGEDKDLVRAGTYLHKYLSQEPEGEEPDAAHAHRLLGLVLEKQKRRVEACQELETALRLKPDFKAAKEDLKRMSGK